MQGFKQNYKGHEFVQFRDKADLFAQNKEVMYNKFKDVKNVSNHDNDDEVEERKTEKLFLNKEQGCDSNDVDKSFQTKDQIE